MKGRGLWDLRAAEGQTRPALLHSPLCHGTAAHSALLLYKGHLQLLLIWNKLAAPRGPEVNRMSVRHCQAKHPWINYSCLH